MSEKDLQKLVEELAEWNGWKYDSNDSINPIDSIGVPRRPS